MEPSDLTPESSFPTGGQVLVEALRQQGVDRVFCVPGESYLAVLDALYDVPQIAVICAHHEGAAANMAEADGKLTGRPGVCFVTRGPGATHASVGVHTAFQDSTPMVLFIGQVARSVRDREAFQEIDFRAMFTPIAKWAAEIDDPARIPEYVQRAFHMAISGRRGPVVLSLPEDMLASLTAESPRRPAAIPAASGPRPQDLHGFAQLLQAASRPLLLLGGGGWDLPSCNALRAFAQRNSLPVLAGFRRQHLLDNRHENYCGHAGIGMPPSLRDCIRSADLIVAIGSRLSENTTGGYRLLDPPRAEQKLVHVHPDPNEIGRVYYPVLGISSTVAAFGQAVADIALTSPPPWQQWLQAARRAYEQFSTATAPAASGVDLAAVVAWLSDHLEESAIVTNGAGNYTVWLHRYFRYRGFGSQLAPVSGAMGYGVSAAIAAKLRHPERQVIAFAGDGCFLMYPQELLTAVRYAAAVVVIVVNNGLYGTIRMHQEQRYPQRAIATQILNPDFIAWAHSCGAHAERVTDTTAFPEAFARAVRARKAALLELCVDPAQLSPTYRMAS